LSVAAAAAVAAFGLTFHSGLAERGRGGHGRCTPGRGSQPP